jgi:peptide chain release factor subunit 1
LPSPVPFENELTIADSPALRQLARLDHDYATTLVVLVDSRAARICEVVMGGWSSETDVISEVPGRHKQGGWAQMRYQRHVKDHMDRHHKEVAEYLASYHQAQPQTFIILSGQDEIIANLRQFLPTQVQQQVLDVVRLDIHESQADILRTAQEVVEQHEREEEQDLVHRLLYRAGHGGLAAVGIQETLDAANAGRMHLLIMHRDLTYPGWHCPGCGHLGAEEAPVCPVCGHTTAAVELGEALLSRALQTDASVELIEPEPRLTAFDGIGVFLRYY